METRNNSGIVLGPTELHRLDRPLWSLWKAALPLVRSGVTPAERHAWTGGVGRSVQAPVLESDLELWTLPGLRSMGMRAKLTPLPDGEEQLAKLIRDATRRGGCLPLLRFREPYSAGGEEMLPPAADRLLSAQALVQSAGPEHLGILDAQNHRTERPWSCLRRFTHAILIGAGHPRGRRARNGCDALVRWAAFSAAFPDRRVSLRTTDRPGRRAGAAFLLGAAGARRDRIATRLRRAGELEAAATCEAEMDEVRWLVATAACLALELPQAALAALASSPGQRLSHSQTQELIYLARAGTPELRVLAVRRLACEGGATGMKGAVAPFYYDRSGWVRAAALHSGRAMG